MSLIIKMLKSPYFALIIVSLIWGSNFIVAKQLVATISPYTLTTGRFTIAFIILLPIYLYNQKKQPHPKIKLKTWALLFFIGLTGTFAFNTMLYIGLKHTSPVNATLINAFNPTATILLTILVFRDRLHSRQLMGLLCSFIGVAWIAIQGQLVNLTNMAFNPGDLIILLATLVWAAYSVGVKMAVTVLSPLVVTTLSIGIGILLLLPTTFIELTYHPAEILTWQTILSLVYLGVFPSVIGFWLWGRGIALVGTAKAAMFYNLIPFFTALMSYIFISEIPRAYHIFGGALILLGVYWGSKTVKVKQTEVI